MSTAWAMGLGLRSTKALESGMPPLAADCLVPGVVVTIEPGLYYPERGLGVRLEDTSGSARRANLKSGAISDGSGAARSKL